MLAAFFMPEKTLAVFASPSDGHINSMNYGVKTNASASNEILVVPSVEEINEVYRANMQNANPLDILENSLDLAGQSSHEVTVVKLFNNSWVIFLSACALVVVIFVLLKLKKVI